MCYFHVPLDQILGTQVKFLGREFHHLADVVRLREGDEVVVLDGFGGVYDVVIESSGRDQAIGKIKSSRHFPPPSVKVTLFIGLPKADKMDMVVQKTAELGIYRIVPVISRYSIPHLSQERAQQRITRWRQIAIEASKQSHRPYFPLIPHILSFDHALKESQAELKLIFVAGSITSEDGNSRIIPDKLKDILRKSVAAKELDLFIGPEGDFSEDEINHAISFGAIPVSLGDNILRTETAAIAALSIVQYEKDAM